MADRVFNPIVGRELIGLVSSRRSLLVQVSLACVFMLLAIIRWPSDAMVDVNGGRALEVFRVFGYGLLIALLLFVPAFPAASIVKERNKGTLALLFNSPMSPWSIYFGKFTGVFVYVALPRFFALSSDGEPQPTLMSGMSRTSCCVWSRQR